MTQETSGKEKLLRLGITRNYGAHSVYFEVSETHTLSSGHQQQEAFDNLHSQLNYQIARYEEFFLPHVKLPASNQTVSQAKTGSTEEIKIDKILVENVGGQRRVKAMGGKYEKFGVPCYKECDSTINLDSLEYGVHDYSHLNLTAVVELQGDKPKRVKSLK